MTFELTLQMMTAASIGATTAAALTITINIFFFAATWRIYISKVARPAINRLSFRLLLWAMLIEVTYAVLWIMMYSDPTMPFLLGKSQVGCSVSMTLLLGSRNVINFLFSCMALNLLLVICFDIRPKDHHLETIYIASSFALGYAPPIIGAALGHYGGDEIFGGACYFAGDGRSHRLTHMIVDAWIWQILSTTIAIVCVIPVMVYFLVRRHETAQSLLQSLSANDFRDSSSSPDKKRRWSIHSLSLKKHKSEEEVIPLNQFADRLMGTCLRISFYPLALIITNGTSIFGDWFFFENTPDTRGKFAVFVIYQLLYGGRGVLFATYGIFVDMCLRKGYRILRHGPSTFSISREASIYRDDIHRNFDSYDIAAVTQHSRSFDNRGGVIPILQSDTFHPGTSPLQSMISPKDTSRLSHLHQQDTVFLNQTETAEMTLTEFFTGPKARLSTHITFDKESESETSKHVEIEIESAPSASGGETAKSSVEIGFPPTAVLPDTQRSREPHLWHHRRDFGESRGGVLPGGLDSPNLEREMRLGEGSDRWKNWNETSSMPSNMRGGLFVALEKEKGGDAQRRGSAWKLPKELKKKLGELEARL